MMKINHKGGKDDFVVNRLFLFCQKNGVYVNETNMIKHSVYLLDTDRGLKILKGYKRQEKIQRIYEFLNQMMDHSVNYVVNYEWFPTGELVCEDEQVYWTLQPYVQCERKFTYKKKKDRMDAIELLHDYHDVSKKVSEDNRFSFDTYSLIQQWSQRLKVFQTNFPMLQMYMSTSQIMSIISWSEQALNYLKKYEKEEDELGQAVIHGDVASHNFLRVNDQQIMMIDFDLASYAPVIYDYIQLAQRYLVYINCSLKRLSSHPSLCYLFQNRFFLSALLFPSHVVREWNRLLIDGVTMERLYRLQAFTTKDLYDREHLAKSILNEL